MTLKLPTCPGRAEPWGCADRGCPGSPPKRPYLRALGCLCSHRDSAAPCQAPPGSPEILLGTGAHMHLSGGHWGHPGPSRGWGDHRFSMAGGTSAILAPHGPLRGRTPKSLWEEGGALPGIQGSPSSRAPGFELSPQNMTEFVAKVTPRTSPDWRTVGCGQGSGVWGFWSATKQCPGTPRGRACRVEQPPRLGLWSVPHTRPYPPWRGLPIPPLQEGHPSPPPRPLPGGTRRAPGKCARWGWACKEPICMAGVWVLSPLVPGGGAVGEVGVPGGRGRADPTVERLRRPH